MSSSKQKVQKLQCFNNKRKRVYSTSLKILSHKRSLPWESVGYTTCTSHKSFAPWIFVPKTYWKSEKLPQKFYRKGINLCLYSFCLTGFYSQAPFILEWGRSQQGERPQLIDLSENQTQSVVFS